MPLHPLLPVPRQGEEYWEDDGDLKGQTTVLSKRMARAFSLALLEMRTKCLHSLFPMQFNLLIVLQFKIPRAL